MRASAGSFGSGRRGRSKWSGPSGSERRRVNSGNRCEDNELLRPANLHIRACFSHMSDLSSARQATAFTYWNGIEKASFPSQLTISGASVSGSWMAMLLMSNSRIIIKGSL